MTPSAAASPPTAPYAANALRRCRPVNSVRKLASTWGATTAAVTPCAIRATTSWDGVWASPESRLATPKPATPTRNSRRRPNRSPSRPAVISVAANASM